MPTIESPRRVETHEPRHTHTAPADSPTHSLRVRMRVAAKRTFLTRQLAQGADPSSTPELALRAYQLTSDRNRRRLARTLRRAISEARDPAVTRRMVSIINRYAIFEAGDAIQQTIARLASPDPVEVKGMAMLEQIVTDGLTSPLYNRAEPGTLRRQLLVTKAELDPTPSPHDLPIAA
ncbi:MAG TPA: hypothetical protein VMF57_15050 [Solirubrobacteraceae bacterium]|nr:hypothetical protein [Solirubrobacteraceae bacterium]